VRRGAERRERDAEPNAVSKKKKASGFNQPFGALEDLKKKIAADEEAAKAAGKKPPPRAPAPAPVATDEDEALAFHRMMSGVVPLDRTRGRVPQTQTVARSTNAELAERRETSVAAAAAEAESVHEHLRTLVEDKARFELSDDGRRVEGRRLDLPPDALRKLRRGLLPIDARIDLHGKRSADARAEVAAFLRDKRARGERCVLIVHGKGEHSPGGMGVLRGEVAAWLSQSAASEHVAAFATATENDGGEGAIYVLLRRH
jgi:DNA-nicking Smr family endonuclease